MNGDECQSRLPDIKFPPGAYIQTVQTLMIVAGALSLASGVVASITLVLPGPPIVFLSLVLIRVATGGEANIAFLVTMGIIATGISVTNRLIPTLRNSLTESRPAILGCLAGMFFGMGLIPPLGLVIGAFAGAVVGDLVFDRNRSLAMAGGWGPFLGSSLGVTLKLCYAGISGYFFVRAILS